MMPSIKTATDASGATQGFKQITSFLGEKTGGLLASLQAATGVEMPNANFDLDNYVADQTMNSLFNSMAGEEKKLRENPAARSTQLLKSSGTAKRVGDVRSVRMTLYNTGCLR